MAVWFKEPKKSKLETTRTKSQHFRAFMLSHLHSFMIRQCYEEGPEVFLVGLRDVVEARGGMTRAAALSKLNRESLYRLISRQGNPRLSSLDAVLTALGLKVTFSAA
ncbi:MAG TPA: hypothetical protein VFC44_07830 [Candidatus Saccharimonadales bacterium]|nr:hypothetical protein [Candidatus Saccharimonadales bacterium]